MVGGHFKNGRKFFFKKKNQKALIPLPAHFRTEAGSRIKVFCLFSSEKKAFLKT
jgi:hypothetical protein